MQTGWWRQHSLLRALLCWLLIGQGLLSGLLLSPHSSEAATVDGAGPAVITENMHTQLVSAYTHVTPGQTFFVAMRQQIRPHWHTYWQNPGDSGEPTQLDWQLPTGWQASALHWPAPQRIRVGPLVNFGYSDEIYLLTEINVPQRAAPGTDITLQAAAYWLVCEEICIPEEGQLQLTLKVADQAIPSPWQGLLLEVQQQLPQAAPWPVTAALQQDQLLLSWPAVDNELVSANYFPLQQSVIQHAAQQQLRQHQDDYKLTIPTDHAASFDRLPGLLVVTSAAPASTRQAFVIEPVMQPTGAIANPTATAPPISVWLALAMAFAGGVILNLMPCVFPVLSIKALSLMQLAAQHPGEQRRLATGHGLAFAGGVILGFVLLAILLLALRSLGVAAGWGFHLQSSWVVLLLAWLFFVIGLNLSGVFEIGARWMGIGQQLTQGHGHRQSLFTGLLATLVATPCTAPFMGAAMGYALLQPVAISLAIFVLLGVGMAMPFLLLCLFPNWLQRLPRPGPWMETFKQLLAYPMYVSSLWLLWVLMKQIGDIGLLLGAGGAIVISFIIWLARITQTTLRRIFRVAAIAVLLGLLTLLPTNDDTQPQLVTQQTDDPWQPYSHDALQQARQRGPVFVNFTADWCITCKANERIALNTAAVNALFKQKQVTRLKADWTKRDATIANTLQQFGRSGVPLYLWYAGPYAGEESSEVEILPQLLTESMLLQRLQALPNAATTDSP